MKKYFIAALALGASFVPALANVAKPPVVYADPPPHVAPMQEQLAWIEYGPPKFTQEILRDHLWRVDAPPFNATSIGTLGGQCPTQGTLIFQSANGLSKCLGVGLNGQVLISHGPAADLGWNTVSGVGTVTSVGVTVPADESVSGSPITAAGTFGITRNTQAANLGLFSPNGSSGVPTYRNVVPTDFGSQSANLGMFSPTGSAGVPTFRSVAATDFAAQTANLFLGAPNGSTGVPSFRGIVMADLPVGTSGHTLTANDGANTFSGVDVFSAKVTHSGDTFMVSGKPWIDIAGAGAVCNGTDNSTIWQNALNSLSAIGGKIYVPICGGIYCAHGLTWPANVSIEIEGESEAGSNVGVCGVDDTWADVNGTNSALRNLTIVGKGNNSDTGTFGASFPTVTMDVHAVGSRIDHVTIYGGQYAFNMIGSDITMVDTIAQFAFGTAIVYTSGGAGNWYLRDKFDQSWPAATPAPGTVTSNAWAATTSYATGAVVVDAGFLIEATAGGTSGATIPTLRNYGLPITDGTVTWQLVHRGTYYAMQFDTGASESTMLQTDMTGSYLAGIAMTNTLAGTPPGYVSCTDCVISQTVNAGAYLHDGHDFQMTSGHIGGVINNAGGSIWPNTNWTGPASIANTEFIGGGNAAAVRDDIGTGLKIVNSTFESFVTGIHILPNISNMLAVGNDFNTTTNSIIVDAGTSDHLDFVGNILGSAAAIVNNGTGSHVANFGNDLPVVTTFNGRANAVAPATNDYQTAMIQTASTSTPVAAGRIGELLSATGASISLTNSVATNVASIGVTAGHWRCFTTKNNIVLGANPSTAFQTSISATTATLDAVSISNGVSYAASAIWGAPAPDLIVQVSGLTNIFLVDFVGAAGATANGTLNCQRTD